MPHAPASSETAIEAAAASCVPAGATAPAPRAEGDPGDALELAGQIAAATGARLYCPTHTARITRGAGRVPVQRIPVPDRPGGRAFADVRNIILVGAKPPVAFFAYPGKPSQLSGPGRASTSWPGPTRTSPAR